MTLSTILKTLSRRKSFNDPATPPKFSKKPEAQFQSQTHLVRTLGLPSVVAIGLGCIIGTGIFVLTGKVALQHSGPGIMLSFLLSGLACLLAALCYAEFAAKVPRSGSAYAYSYVTLGEFVAWLIGWDLILEYGLAIVTVASGWSSHLISIVATLSSFSWHADPHLAGAAGAAAGAVGAVAASTGASASLAASASANSLAAFLPQEWINTPFDPILAHDPDNPGKILRTPDGQPVVSGYGIANLPAMAIVFLLCSLLLAGIKSSIRFNNIMVVMKLSIAIFFVGVGFLFVDPSNWFPLIPEFTPQAGLATGTDIENLPLWQLIGNAFGYSFSSGFGGISGIFTGAAILFYAYLGFDAITTAAEEVKNPKRNLPLGILISVMIATVLYILMAAVFTGLVNTDGSLKFEELGIFKGAPLAYAFSTVPVLNRYALLFIEIGGFLGITSVLLVLLYAQSRIVFSISRDGLLPAIFSKVHPKTKIPSWSLLIVGGSLGVIAGFVPLYRVAELVNVGTLSAFFLVSFAILILRRKTPQQMSSAMSSEVSSAMSSDQFQIPWVPLIPILSMFVCLILMLSLPFTAWSRFFIWMMVGVAIYIFYGRRHSRLANHQ